MAAQLNSEPALPLVSVITATLNPGPLLANTATSLNAQDYPNIEWIVADGGSPPESLGDVHRFAKSTVLQGPDTGIYDAWNKGIEHASGDWLCFLGAGDTFVPGAISAYVSFAAKQQTILPDQLEYVSSLARLVRHGVPLRTIGKAWTWREFRIHMCCVHCGSFHHRSLFNGSKFDTSYAIAGDYDFLLRRGANLRAAFLKAVTTEMLIGGVSDSGEKAIREVQRAKLRNRARTPWEARLDSYLAYAKWRARNLFWY